MVYESIPIDFIVKLGKSAIDQDNIGLANGVWYILEKWKLHQSMKQENNENNNNESEDVNQ